jgi:AraC family transcriptional regulator of adaptative response/methylated-DNA-[protein]-cysteine methyltransferase
MSATAVFPDYLCRQMLTTPLGAMLAIADDNELSLLEFRTRKDLDGQLKTLGLIDSRPIVDESNAVLRLAQQELDAYFRGDLTNFSVRLKIKGSPFRESVWHELTRIPYGETVSYQELGRRIAAPKACRAIGSANGHNRIAIMIPCHRVIRADGSTGGYAGGTNHKQWLLGHESRFREKHG